MNSSTCTEQNGCAKMSCQDSEEDVMQVDELQLLQAMYEPGKELVFSRTNGNSSNSHVVANNFMIRLDFNGILVEVFVQLPKRYPLGDYPIVRLSTDAGNYNVEEINHFIRTWIKCQELGRPLVSEMLEEIRENLDRFRVMKPSPIKSANSSDSAKNAKVNDIGKWARYWILTHHLYSYEKRQNMAREADILRLGGFCTPGKPAVIVVEGDASRLRQFWQTIRSWSWKKITLMESEEAIHSDCHFLRFGSKFTEHVFDCESGDHRKVDTARVKKVLDEHSLVEHFNILYDI